MSRPRRLWDKLLLRTFGQPRGLLGRLGGLIMARTNREAIEHAIALSEVQPSDRVIEIGFGPGVGVELLARAASSGFVAGVDPSVEMLRQASSRNSTAIADGRVNLRLGSVENMPFENGTFDKALATNSLQLWPDALAGLREVHRVLRPGGRLVLSFTRHSGQDPEGLIELLGQAGFPEADLQSDTKHGRFFLVATRR